MNGQSIHLGLQHEQGEYHVTVAVNGIPREAAGYTYDLCDAVLTCIDIQSRCIAAGYTVSCSKPLQAAIRRLDNGGVIY